jgi:hypothetical protein
MLLAEDCRSLFLCSIWRLFCSQSVHFLFIAALVFVSNTLNVLQALCGDGLLEALGVTTDGQLGISDSAWQDFVNNVSQLLLSNDDDD